MSPRPIKPRPRTRRPSVRRGWDQAAETWDDFVESGKDWSRHRVHGPALLRVVGPVSGAEVLDVGCGQGYLARALARRGAQVTGVDRSLPLLRLAQRHQSSRAPTVDYRQLDARRLEEGFPPASFDLVVSCMALMDLPRPDRVLRGAFRVLRPGGRLVFSTTHPFNDAPVSRWTHTTVGRHGARVVDRYFEEGRSVFRWNLVRLLHPFEVDAWHWTMGSWFRMIRSAGFLVEGLREPRPTPRQVSANPGLEGPSRVPFWIVWDCRRMSTLPRRTPRTEGRNVLRIRGDSRRRTSPRPGRGPAA